MPMVSASQDTPEIVPVEPASPAGGEKGRLFRAGDFLVALAAAGASMLLYLLTLGPTITGEDSGEFSVAAYLPGIPHPPGYPLYCLLGHLFSLIPHGEVAWRINLMSAVFAAGTIFLLTLTLICLTRNRTASFLAALAFACSREFWAQAVIAEVYTLNLFFMAACFLALLVWTERRDNRLLYLFALLFGLGLTVHNTFMLIALPCALYVVIADWRARTPGAPFWRPRLRIWLACFLIAASALLLYAYLPIRSLTNPALDWGNPENLANFYRHVRRVQYDFMFSQYPRSLERFLGQMDTYARFWWGEFGPGLGLLGLAGLFVLLWHRFAYGVFLVFSALLVVAGFSFWQNFEQTREWLWVMRVFALPAYYVTAIGLGCLLAGLGRGRAARRNTTVMLGIVVVLAPLVLNFQRNDKSDYYWTRDYGANILVSLERDAIYVSESDHGSFSVLYLQTVFGMRPDVVNLRRYGYLESSLLQEMPQELRDKFGPFPPRRYDPEIIAWLVDHTSRPLYLSEPMHLPTEKPVHIVPAGLTFRVLREGETATGEDYWSLYQWRTLDPECTRGDYTADAILYDMDIAKAYGLLMRAEQGDGDKERLHSDALVRMESALQAYGRDAAALNNVGVLCARYGLYTHACDYFREALDRLPGLTQAKNNLDRALEKCRKASEEGPVSARPQKRVKRAPMPVILLSRRV